LWVVHLSLRPFRALSCRELSQSFVADLAFDERSLAVRSRGEDQLFHAGIPAFLDGGASSCSLTLARAIA
jgi:hypothetical protein